MSKAGGASRCSTSYKRWETGTPPVAASDGVPVFRPSIEGGKPVHRETIRSIASLLANGYLRLLAPGSAAVAHPPCATEPQVSLDSLGQQSDELGAHRGNRRRQCKPA